VENFDELALRWDEDPKRRKRARVVAMEMAREIPDLERMTGFEYGCGTGLLSFYLQPFMREIWLGDSSAGMLSVAEQKIQTLRIANMHPLPIDLTAAELPELKFDVVYTLMALHHIKPLNDVLQSFYEMLHPEGTLCIADLDKEDGTFHGPGFTGHHGFDVRELSATLREIGFTNLRSKICHTIVKQDRDRREKQYPLFLLIGQKR
jgi:ubiquinone/menaquinone biosynthesis C-methylase UbiE